MSSISAIIAEVAAAAKANDQGENPETHAALLHGIERLQLAAEKPAETAKRIIYQPPTNAALRVAVELGLIDTVASRIDDPITAHQLAVERDTDELLVIRVMRAMTAMGICTEAGAGLYSPNPVTRQFATEGIRDGVKAAYDAFMPAAANLVECLHHNGMRAPKEAKETPFFAGTQVSFFQWLKENPQQRKLFDSWMGLRRIQISPWYETFLMTDQFTAGLRSDPHAVLIVDVGGSHGHDLVKFKQQYPELPGKLILQDLPETINSLRGGLSGIEPMAHDFYQPQPVKGARVYYFGAICHDWADEFCIKFLSNTAAVMEKGYSILLINDYVVPETGAPLNTAVMDILMMNLFAGIERTQSQWTKLLSSSGLSLTKVWRSGNRVESIIEASLKP